MPNPIRILHLSDLHYGGSTDSKIVLAALEETMKDSAGGGIDLMIFSGDLVSKGGEPKLFEAARRDFIEPMLSAIGLTEAEFVICPGNHDLDREAVRATGYIETGLFQTLNTRDAINSFVEKQWSETVNVTALSPFERLKNFYTSQWSATHPHRVFANPLVAVYQYRVRDTGIAIACFNTAWRATGEPNDIDKNHLILGERTIDRAVALLGEADIRIAVYHHPTNWLQEEDQAATESRLQNEFDVLISGHLHRNAPEFRSTLAGDAIMSPGGALYVSREWYNGFSILTLNTDAPEVTFSLYEYSDARRIFFRAERLVEGGEKRYPLIPSAKRSGDSLAGIVRRARPLVRQKANAHLSLDGSTIRDIESDFVCPPLNDISLMAANGGPLDSSTPAADSAVSPADTLHDLLKGSDNIVFIGQAELGKTSLAHFIANKICDNQVDVPRIPLMFPFSKLRNGGPVALWQCAREYANEISDGAIKHSVVEKEPLFVIVDDVDLFNGTRLGFLKELIDRHKNVRWCLFARNPAGPGLDVNRIAIDSFVGFKALALGELTRGAIRTLSASWMQTSRDDEANDAMFRNVMEQIQRTGLPRSGYIVSLMLWALKNSSQGELLNEAVLLENMIDHMLGRMDYTGALRREFDFQSKSAVLQTLAMWFKQTSQYHTKNDIVRHVIEFLNDRGLRYDATDIVNGFIQCRILIQTGDDISFRYKRFQEFFVAGFLRDEKGEMDRIIKEGEWLEYARELDLYTARFRHESLILDHVRNGLVAIKVPEPELSEADYAEYMSTGKDPGMTRSQLAKMRSQRMTAERVDRILDRVDRKASSNMLAIQEATSENGPLDEAQSAPLMTYGITLALYSQLIRNLEFVGKEVKRENVELCIASWAKALRGVTSSYKMAMEEIREDALTGDLAGPAENAEMFKNFLDHVEATLKVKFPTFLSQGAYHALGSEKLVDFIDEIAQDPNTAAIRRLLCLFILIEMDPSRAIERLGSLIDRPNFEGWQLAAVSDRLFAYYRTRPLPNALRPKFEDLVTELQMKHGGLSKKGGIIKGQLLNDLRKQAFRDDLPKPGQN